MPTEIKVPQSHGRSAEVKIHGWRKAVGDYVEVEEELFSLRAKIGDRWIWDGTHRAPVSGILTTILKEQDEEAVRGEVVGLIEKRARPFLTKDDISSVAIIMIVILSFLGLLILGQWLILHVIGLSTALWIVGGAIGLLVIGFVLIVAWVLLSAVKGLLDFGMKEAWVVETLDNTYTKVVALEQKLEELTKQTSPSRDDR